MKRVNPTIATHPCQIRPNQPTMKPTLRNLRLYSQLTLLAALLAPTVLRADTVTWNGLGLDQNWSSGGNWTNETTSTSGTAPGSADDVRFFDSGFTSPIVDNAFGGTIASLRFGSTNNDYATTISGTLNVTGTGGLRVGTPGDTGTALVRTATFSGGALNLNNTAANIVLNQGTGTAANGSRAILDLRGLDTFTANLRGIGLGTLSYPNSVGQRNSGTIYLAKTNVITLSYAQPLSVYTANAAATNAIELVQVGAGNNAATLSFFYLGQTNALFVDSIGIGRSKASTTSAGSLLFDPALTSPSAYFRGIGGANSRVTWWAAGDMSSSASSAQHAVGTNNFTGGFVDALVETMSLGRDCSANHTASGTTRINTGVLTFDNGKIDVNTLVVGNQSVGPNTSVTMNMGIVNVNSASATLIVNSNLALAFTTHTGPSALATSGFLNVNGGTVRAHNISVGASSTNNAINLTGSANLIVTNTVGAAKPVRTLTMSDSTLTLHLNGAAPVVSATNLTTGGSGNSINIGSSIVFGSYPAQIPLLKYVTLGGSGNNFTLGAVPASMAGASLSNNTFNSSIDLYLPSDPRPVVTNQPSGFSGAPGSLVTLSAGVDGIAPLTYQWRRNGTNISDLGNWSGTSTDSLTISSAQVADSGSYDLVINNAYGSTTSLVASVTISSGNVAPSLTGPVDQAVLENNTAVFTATASGVPTPALQWFKNGSPLGGENASTLTLLNVQYPFDQAVYSLRATNVAGVVSNSATLTVIVPPGITAEPASVTAAQGAPASFTVAATGNPAPTYQWNKNGNIIPNATNATLNFAAVVPTDAASYAVLINNAGGATNSVTVTLTVTSTSLTYTNLSPADNATAVCYDTPLYLRFNNPPTLGNTQLRIYDSTDALVDTIDLSLNDVNNGQTRVIAGATYYTYPVIIRSNTAAIFPHLGVLTSNMQYYVIMDTGFFKDTGGASMVGISSPTAWSFTTKLTGPDYLVTSNIVVAADGTGDFMTVQGAIDSIPAGTTPIEITLRKGSYEEINRIPSGKNNLTFIGEGCLESIITYANNNSFQLGNAGTGSRIMFFAGGNDCTFKNIWFANSTPQGGSQAEAIRVQGGRIILDNCKLTSYQDTILINTANTSAGYFNKCLVQGDVDFIWGSGIGFFDQCEMRAMQRSGNSGGIYTQARTGTGVYGLIFRDCDITKSAASVTNNWTLGRDGGNGNPYGNVAWLNCRIDDHISGAGWTDGGLTDKSTLRFWEYLNRNITDTAYVATNARVPWALQLDAPTADAASNPTNVFASIAWEPTLATYIACPPANQTAYLGQTVTIEAHVGGFPQPVYQWYKGATLIPGATNENLVIVGAQASAAGSYSVRATNDLGFAISSSGTLTLIGSPSLGTPTLLGNGSVQFTFNGIAGTGYRIWASTNVALAPITSTWTLLSTGSFTASPVVFADAQATNFPQRFYILTLP
jgi:pectin methylesterase-like acyl-CoA thioesterase